jgi:hypothetical protein
MGRKDFQNTVADILPVIIENEAKTGIGALHFYKKDKKTRGKLYFRGGAIYAIELSTYTPNIVNRIVTNEFIKETAREQILSRFGATSTSWAVVPFALTGQLFPERPLLGYIKDYFLDAFDELYSWEAVNAEFKTNEEPSIPSVPNVNPMDLIEKAKMRRSYLETRVATTWNSTLSQIDSLVFRRNTNQYDDGSYTSALLLSVADGKRTIREATEYLGMSRFNVKKDLFGLWEAGVVDIVHPSGLIITNRSPEDIQNRSRPAQAPRPATTSQVAPTPQPQVAQAPVDLAVQPQPSVPVAPATAPVDTQTPVAAPVETVAPAVAPDATPPVAPQTPATPEAPLLAAASTANPGSRIATLAQQLREALAATDQAIQTQKDQRDNLLKYRETLESELKSLQEKVQMVTKRLEDANSDLSTVEGQLAELEQERAATMGFLN